jgi:hypothetical protein
MRTHQRPNTPGKHVLDARNQKAGEITIREVGASLAGILGHGLTVVNRGGLHHFDHHRYRDSASTRTALRRPCLRAARPHHASRIAARQS